MTQATQSAAPAGRQTFTFHDAAKECEVDLPLARFLVRHYRIPVLQVGQSGRRVLPASSLPALRGAILDHRATPYNDLDLPV